MKLWLSRVRGEIRVSGGTQEAAKGQLAAQGILLEGSARSLGLSGLGEALKSPSLPSTLPHATWKLRCAFGCLQFWLQNGSPPGVPFLPISLFSLQNFFLFFFSLKLNKMMNHQSQPSAKAEDLGGNSQRRYVSQRIWLSLSCVRFFVTPWTVALQASLSMGFPRQAYWSRLPFPPPGDLPNLWIKPTSLALAGRFFTTESPGKQLRG